MDEIIAPRTVSTCMTLVDKLEVALDEPTHFELRKDDLGYHVCIANPDGTMSVIDKLKSRTDDAARNEFGEYVRGYVRQTVVANPIKCREPFSDEEE
ncbi:hypothetical protein HY493_05495 [Candidatus Woesearchaeota archaeon]|nr:hypothetical protein [Candidatus Woesearchaeota archaeon]